MHPILFKIGNITLYTYGLFVALGFMTALGIANKRAEKRGIKPELISDLFFLILLSSLLGARFFYIILNFSEFRKDPLEVFRIWNGGLVFYGGFLFALIAALVFVRRQKADLWEVGDILAPPIAIGHAIGRIGCLSAGCCYGRVCHLPWAMEFHNLESLAPRDVPLHPTQIYSMVSNLLIFIVLLLMDRHKKFKGQIFWTYILLYGLMRSFIETFRGDFRGNFFMDILSVSQAIGIAMSFFAAFILFLLARQGRYAGD